MTGGVALIRRAAGRGTAFLFLVAPSLLPLRADAARGDAQSPGKALVDRGSLKGWSVECHEESSAAESRLRCDGPSSAEILLHDGPRGRAPRLLADIGQSDWVQAIHQFDIPLDLSRADVFRFALQGTKEAGAANAIGVMFSDVNDVFYGYELVTPRHGITQFGRWSVRRSVPRSAFGYYFNKRGKKSPKIDWTRIKRFYWTVVRPCVKEKGTGQEVCFGGGKEDISLDKAEYASFQEGREEPGKGIGGEEDTITFWRGDGPLPGGAESFSDASPGWKGTMLLDGGSLDGWTAECDGGYWIDGYKNCAGLSTAVLESRKPEGGSPVVRLAWNMDSGSWSQAKHSFPEPVDLSGADALAVTLEGEGNTLGKADEIHVMFADNNGVFYGYGLDARGFLLPEFQRWRIHLSLLRKSIYHMFTLGDGGKTIDWAHIDRFFFAVKKMRTDPSYGGGVVGFVNLQYRLSEKKPREAKPAPPPEKAIQERWSYTLYFPKDASRIPSSRIPDIEKVAEHIELYKEHDVLITGFSDRRESDPEALASERAKHLAVQLEKAHGIPADRFKIETRPPRRSFPGESLQKAVVSFLDLPRP